MSSTRLHCLFPVGTLMLAAGLLLHNWIHGRYTEFTAGLLIGMSIVLVTAGFVKARRARFER